MDYTDELLDELLKRLARIEGQVRGIATMLGERRECRDVVTQIAAASKALDQVGFRLVAAGLSSCLQEPDPETKVAEFERMFSKLA